MQRILLIEDDDDIGQLISRWLTRHDMEVIVESNGALALERVNELVPDLVLLDIMLPGQDGLSICRALRPLYQGPIVMLTSLDSDMNQVLALELGANDYILKTTPPAVLLARLRVQFRQHNQPAPTLLANNQALQLQFGRLRIDGAARSVQLDNQFIALSTADFDLLWALAEQAGQIISRERLFQQLRGRAYDGLDRTMDVAISRLRKKLNDDPSNPTRIKTVRNKGYLFVPHTW